MELAQAIVYSVSALECQDCSETLNSRDSLPRSPAVGRRVLAGHQEHVASWTLELFRENLNAVHRELKVTQTTRFSYAAKTSGLLPARSLALTIRTLTVCKEPRIDYKNTYSLQGALLLLCGHSQPARSLALTIETLTVCKEPRFVYGSTYSPQGASHRL
ncbi:hypothetical protein PoB_003066900 [Plakobranchus ocellatus]|uniref:Uncharacterized protein n=1 Tax=Plakobranchus ocellatus TaxID=259542 RepID=A0AAV4ACK6_9GAST|nr:hypothetical protein PoB_003066900 [Plakobranchus ocellatus]